MFRWLTLLPMLLILSMVVPGQATDECKETLVVNALNGRGIPVSELSANDFTASSQGRKMKIVSSTFEQNRGGRTVVLLDASGSMGHGFTNKWRIALAAASEFVSSAPDRTQISLLAFADRIKQKFNSAGGRKVIDEWLRNSATDPAYPNGPTALYETILEALRSLEPPQPGDSIYVITDAGDNKSSETMSRMDHELQRSGSRLFVFLLNDAEANAEGLDARDLYELAYRSGGFLASISPHKLRPTVTGSYDYDSKVLTAIRTSTKIIEEQMGNYYVLGIQLQNRVSKPENWKLEAVDAQGRKRKDVSLAYPSKLPGCALQSAKP